MRLPRRQNRREMESTIPLINVVFLMLIFFLIAGTIAPPIDRDVALIATQDADQADPPEALAVTRDGTLRWRGRTVDVEAFASRWVDEGGDERLKLAADRDLPAADLIDIVAALRANGVETISVLTERAAQ